MTDYRFLNNLSEIPSDYLNGLYEWLENLEPRRKLAEANLAEAKEKLRTLENLRNDTHLSAHPVTTVHSVKDIIKADYLGSDYIYPLGTMFSEYFTYSEVLALMGAYMNSVLEKLPSYSMLPDTEKSRPTWWHHDSYMHHDTNKWWLNYEVIGTGIHKSKYHVYNKRGYIQLWNMLAISFAGAVLAMIYKPLLNLNQRFKGGSVPQERAYDWFSVTPLSSSRDGGYWTPLWTVFSNTSEWGKDEPFSLPLGWLGAESGSLTMSFA